MGKGGLWIVLCWVLLARASGDAEGDKIHKALVPEEFQAWVVSSGGSVDFVFEDERPFRECHASTLVEAGDGSLLCAWFGGPKEADPGVAIWFSRCRGGKWSSCTRVAKVDETAHWNPVLFRDPEGGVFLFFKVGPNVPGWRTYWMRSGDDGATWSAPVELVSGDVGGRGPVKNKPLILSDGAWLAPASTENERWQPFADRSQDCGVTWQRTACFTIDPDVIGGVGAIQPTFWESAPGKVHALMRTAVGCIARADSQDSGHTWCPVTRTSLPNNNGGIDALRLQDGRVLLAYNPVGESGGPRTPLALAVSSDNGMTWQNLGDLETERGEYSYPAIAQTTRGVAVSYTWKRERIRCWQIPLASLGGI